MEHPQWHCSHGQWYPPIFTAVLAVSVCGFSAQSFMKPGSPGAKQFWLPYLNIDRSGSRLDAAGQSFGHYSSEL